MLYSPDMQWLHKAEGQFKTSLGSAELVLLNMIITEVLHTNSSLVTVGL